ncbi:MAG TPA: Rpn family recombination-promoting nuclease/putative transposase, partial [Gammaproteobacteria bacterium]|nr:Rpn family recombination-promoting nuclease/putative transposase [Gammaproteobacteria bacterium]
MNNNQSFVVHAHDQFFRTVMADQRVACDFLMAYLPKEMSQVIDWKKLELQQRSYIDEVRKESIVDVLYKTKINEKEAYLYLLLEHQSTPDELMPFRLLKYICAIIDQHLKVTKEKFLPLVYPVVVYHADRPYPYSTDIKDLVDAPKELIEHYFLKPFQLIDLGQIKDEELKAHTWSGVMEFALKHVFARDLLPHLQDAIELF